MRKSLRYLFILMLLISALFLAFRAGQEGVSTKAEDQKASQKLFRSFPLFGVSSEGSVTTEMDTEAADPPAEQKKTQKSPKSNQKIQDIKPLQRPKPISHEVSHQPTAARERRSQIPDPESLSTGAFALTADSPKGRTEKNSKRLRHKTTPRFSEVFIPVYTQENFDAAAFAGFDPSTDLSGMIFVIEREIPSGEADSSYEISVYAEEGRRFITTIETNRTTHFPFIGVPRFMPVQQQAFIHSNRFFIFSDSFERSEEIFNQEDHARSVLKTAYRPELEKQTFVGTDPNFGLKIYSLFPGVYLAQQSIH